MGFFDLFRVKRKKLALQCDALAASPALSNEPPLILKNSIGLEFQVPREQWRTKILPENLHRSWNNSETLYAHVVQGLNDGFAAEVRDAAHHLSQTDPNRERGLAIEVVALLQLNEVKAAKLAVNTGLAELPNSAMLLNLLCRTVDATGGAAANAQVLAALERSLHLDPNQEQALVRYIDLTCGAQGRASESIYQRLAERPGAWWPQLHIAWQKLEEDNLPQALALYGQVVRDISPLPLDAFIKIATNLGDAGHFEPLIRLLAPKFQATNHGLGAGAHLLKAYCAVKQVPKGLSLLRELRSHPQPGWADVLAYWESEFQQISDSLIVDAQQLGADSAQVALLVLDRPVWLALDAALESFGLSLQGKRVAVVCASSQAPELAGQVEALREQASQEVGLVARGAALHFAQALALGTDARVEVWVPRKEGAFVLGDRSWKMSDLATTGPLPEAVVFGHLNTNLLPWSYSVNVLDPSTGELFWNASASIDPQSPVEGIERLSLQVVQAAVSALELQRVILPVWAEPVVPVWGFGYMQATDQALAIRAALQDDPHSLHEVGTIFECMLSMSASNPSHGASVLLYALSLYQLKAAFPGEVLEFRERTRELFKAIQSDAVIDAVSMAEFKRLCVAVYPKEPA